jgi:hypothetical protein
MRSLKIQPDPKKKEIKTNQTHKTKTKHIKKKKKTFTNNIDLWVNDLSPLKKKPNTFKISLHQIQETQNKKKNGSDNKP